MTAPPAASPAKRPRQTAVEGIVNAMEESWLVKTLALGLSFEWEARLVSTSTPFEGFSAAIAEASEATDTFAFYLIFKVLFWYIFQPVAKQ